MIHFDNVKLIYARPSSSAGHLRCCVFIIISVSAIAKKKKKNGIIDASTRTWRTFEFNLNNDPH